jgi:dTMP kinase
VGRLVVIEGLDGAGKRTLAGRLASAVGGRVARFAFPRYTEDVHAELVRDALYGRMGDLADSVYGMAVLFALDRRAAAPALRAAVETHDLVLVDRYVASNAAYGAARRHEGALDGFVDWVRALEIERFGIPVPDHQLHLAVPGDVAAARAAHRERTEDRARDAYEADDDLQERTGAVYAELAATAWLSPWSTVDDTTDISAALLNLGLR